MLCVLNIYIHKQKLLRQLTWASEYDPENKEEIFLLGKQVQILYYVVAVKEECFAKGHCQRGGKVAKDDDPKSEDRFPGSKTMLYAHGEESLFGISLGKAYVPKG